MDICFHSDAGTPFRLLLERFINGRQSFGIQGIEAESKRPFALCEKQSPSAVAKKLEKSG